MESKEIIILGGGPAGMSAGIYACRAARKTAMIERGAPGGQASTTETIENYPGFPGGLMGPDLMAKMFEHAKSFGLDYIYGIIEGIVPGEKEITVKTHNGEIKAKSVIVATGAQPKELGVPGERELRGRGVSYCATCDGNFFTGKTVAVIGGGDSAVEEAMYLTKLVEKVYLIHRRDELRATKILQDRIKKNPKVEFVWDTVVEEILGNDSVKAIKVKNVKTGKVSSITVEGVFVYIGFTPNTDIFKGILNLDDHGYIITDEKMRTNVKGVFAAGDVRQKDLRQVVTAVSDGAIAAVMADRYIDENGL